MADRTDELIEKLSELVQAQNETNRLIDRLTEASAAYWMEMAKRFVTVGYEDCLLVTIKSSTE